MLARQYDRRRRAGCVTYSSQTAFAVVCSTTDAPVSGALALHCGKYFTGVIWTFCRRRRRQRDRASRQLRGVTSIPCCIQAQQIYGLFKYPIAGGRCFIAGDLEMLFLGRALYVYTGFGPSAQPFRISCTDDSLLHANRRFRAPQSPGIPSDLAHSFKPRPSGHAITWMVRPAVHF